MNQIPRPEHPMPQMERKNWMNLNGEWEFDFDFGMSGIDRNFQAMEHLSKSILVPFCPESKLSGIGYTDFIPAVLYKKHVMLSAEQCMQKILLHFGAVDYACTVFINGSIAGTHKGGYSSFSFDISEYAVPGDNDISVFASDDLRSGSQPRGKQCQKFNSFGCEYTRTTGIWQTVWLEFVPLQYIKHVKYYPNISESTLTIVAQLTGTGTFTASASFDKRACGSAAQHAEHGQAIVTLPISELHLWEPGNGVLYDLVLTYEQDTVESYFGMREVTMDGMRFILNGASLFQRLVLDQGFYPDGIYTAPTEEALIQDILLSMDMGFQGARLHEKIFEPRFLYHCDRLGYLVWGEHANWGLDISKEENLLSFLPEWLEAVNRDFNHPSIIGWCPFNETWDNMGRKQIDEILSLTYLMTKQIDTTRPCIDTSGNFHTMTTDIFDFHNYTQSAKELSACYEPLLANELPIDEHDKRQKYTPGLPVMISEYGGIFWDHDQSSSGWGYGAAPKSREEFLQRYEDLTTVLLNNPKICGFCYTQLYDVEQEKNGLYTYDRREKFPKELISAVNSRMAAIEKQPR